MFIALETLPDVPSERDAELRDWFAWSNERLAAVDGLRSRRLLRSSGGQYAVLVEHESELTFADMHVTPEVAQVEARLHLIVPDVLGAQRFEVVSATDAHECCRSGAGHRHTGERGAANDLPGAADHQCCHAG